MFNIYDKKPWNIGLIVFSTFVVHKFVNATVDNEILVTIILPILTIFIYF